MPQPQNHRTLARHQPLCSSTFDETECSICLTRLLLRLLTQVNLSSKIRKQLTKELLGKDEQRYRADAFDAAKAAVLDLMKRNFFLQCKCIAN